MGLRTTVPHGKTLIVIASAPIQLPARTAKALQDKIRSRLAGQPKRFDLRDTINGNEIRARLVSGSVRGQSNVIAFVQNPDADADALLKTTQSLLEQVAG